jgi:hypothetical protein
MSRQCLLPHRLPPPATTLSNHGVESGLVQGFLRLSTSIVIFLGSYLPLALILLVQDFNYDLIERSPCWHIGAGSSDCVIPLAHPKFSLAILIICFSCFCMSLAALSLARPKLPIDITEAKYILAELMSYTLPYVVSFMSIGYQDAGKFTGLTIFLAWMFWITYKSGQLILNPLLTVFGWRLYEIKYVFPGDDTVQNARALGKGIIESGRRYPHIVVRDVFIVRPSEINEER